MFRTQQIAQLHVGRGRDVIPSSAVLGRIVIGRWPAVLSQFVGTDDHQQCECRHGFIQSNERDVIDDNGRIRQPVLRVQALPGYVVDRQSQRSERLAPSKCSHSKALTRHSVVINNGNVVVLAVDGIRSGIDDRHIRRIVSIHGSG
jgi:hypothetical protein